MSGEQDREFNPNYHEYDGQAKKNVEDTKFLNKSRKQLEDRMISVKVNGVEYDSVIAAANAIGVTEPTIGKHLKALSKTKMSKIEVDISVRKTFVFEKIK